MKQIYLGIIFLMLCVFGKAQSPSFKWAKAMGSTNFALDRSAAICADALGNVYTTGTFKGNADFDPGPATYTLNTNINTKDVFILKLDSLGDFIWAKKLGGNGDDYGNTIKVDGFGNIVIAGYGFGTIDYDPGLAVVNVGTPGATNSFILKLDSNGNFVWAKTFGNNSTTTTNDLALDSQGNVYSTGFFADTVDFDPGNGVFKMFSFNYTTASFILKLDNNGGFIWAKSVSGINDGSFNNSAESYSIKFDAMGNVYTAGRFSGIVDFDSGIGTYTVSPNGNGYPNTFISKLNSSGDFIWAKKMGGYYGALFNSMDLDLNGNIYTAGSFQGTGDFDPDTAGIFNLTQVFVPGISDAFISKLDSNGNFVWAKSISGKKDKRVMGISIDLSGSLCVVGRFRDTVDFDPSLAVMNVHSLSATKDDIFVLKINTNGSYIWVGSIGSGNDNVANAVSLDNSNNIYVTGGFSAGADFDIGSGTYTLNTTGGGMGMFIFKLSQPCITPVSPINITPSTNQTVCISSSTTLSVTSVGNVNWFATSSGTNSIGTGTFFITPVLASGTYTYYAEANTCTVSVSRTAITVTVDPTCADVWPGDANSDGLADNLDVLELGLHYTQTGASRATTSNVWQSYFASNWTGTITNGKNLNHSDCNGDGTINDNDTLAIYNNYGLTHAFKPVQTSTVNPQLSIVPDQSSVVKGAWGTASIYLGDAITSINNINGVAFTVDFDNTLIETNSIYIEYQNSFLDAGQNLDFRKLDFANGKIFTATTHTVNNDVSGNGLIAKLHYQIKSSLTTDQVLNLGISQANQSDASGLFTPLTTGTGTLMAMGTSVGLQELDGNFISISPNPTSGSLTINSKTELQKIEVISITGQLLLSETSTNVSHTLHLQNFSNGIYFVNVYQNDRVVKREKIVFNK